MNLAHKALLRRPLVWLLRQPGLRSNATTPGHAPPPDGWHKLASGEHVRFSPTGKVTERWREPSRPLVALDHRSMDLSPRTVALVALAILCVLLLAAILYGWLYGVDLQASRTGWSGANVAGGAQAEASTPNAVAGGSARSPGIAHEEVGAVSTSPLPEQAYDADNDAQRVVVVPTITPTPTLVPTLSPQEATATASAEAARPTEVWSCGVLSDEQRAQHVPCELEEYTPTPEPTSTPMFYCLSIVGLPDWDEEECLSGNEGDFTAEELEEVLATREALSEDLTPTVLADT